MQGEGRDGVKAVHRGVQIMPYPFAIEPEILSKK
jgi:hypothetical protein